MSFSILTLIPWFLLSILVAGMHIFSSVILLKERHIGAWLMLVGSVVTILGEVGSIVVQFVAMRNLGSFGNWQWLTAIAGISGLGALLFAIGLLLHALHQRNKTNRIAELEAILNSRQE
jgi:hypothetical protein